MSNVHPPQLWNTPAAQPADDAALEQYKLYVETTDRLAVRRDAANAFFVTVHAGLMAAAGFIFEKLGERSSWVALVPIVIAALVLCWTWSRRIHSYRQLSTGRFKVIHEMEQRLPMNVYDYEWRQLGEGKDHSKYAPLTTAEKSIPWIFAVVYVVLAAIVGYSGHTKSTAEAHRSESGGAASCEER